MKPSEQRWPAQQAPDDFADRVVQAGLGAARANLAELDAPAPRASIERLGFFRRPAVPWTLAAALAVGAIAVYFERAEFDAELRAQRAAQLAAVQDEMLVRGREVDELRAKVAKLEAELASRRKLERLDPSQLRALPATGTMSDGKPAPPAASRPACQCQPGDPLCSCL